MVWGGGRELNLTPNKRWVAVSHALQMILLASLLAVPWVTLGLPPGAKAAGDITDQWVDQKLTDWKPVTVSPMSFGATFERASYDNILKPFNTPSVQASDLNLLLATGSRFIRIDIGFDAWLQNNSAAKQEMGSLISKIASDGGSLVIADAAAEAYRNGGQIPWSQFKTAWIQRVVTLASTYHPSAYIVVKEPGWYFPLISDLATNPAASDPNDWLNLTNDLISGVHSVSPETRVGVAIAADGLTKNPAFYIPYMKGVLLLQGLAFVGFDIYTTTGFDNTQNFLSNFGSGGKDVWIAECWSGDGAEVYDSSRSSLDAKWVQVAYYFAQLIGAKVMVPFYTDLAASYSLTDSSPTDAASVYALFQQRTLVFSAYQDIASTSSVGTGGWGGSASPGPGGGYGARPPMRQ